MAHEGRVPQPAAERLRDELTFRVDYPTNITITREAAGDTSKLDNLARTVKFVDLARWSVSQLTRVLCAPCVHHAPRVVLHIRRLNERHRMRRPAGYGSDGPADEAADGAR